jgi:hypothetical protein
MRKFRGNRVDSWRDMISMIVGYIKQETLSPLRGIGRFLGFGIAAAICFAFASVFFVLAMLRALQTETGDTFTGDWDWVPYLLTLLLSLLIAAIAMSSIGSAKRRIERSRKKTS